MAKSYIIPVRLCDVNRFSALMVRHAIKMLSKDWIFTYSFNPVPQESLALSLHHC